MYVVGNGEDARTLAEGIVAKTKNMHELTNDIHLQLKILENSFQDEGFKEFEDVVKRVYQSILAHVDDVQDLQRAIYGYANILENK